MTDIPLDFEVPHLIVEDVIDALNRDLVDADADAVRHRALRQMVELLRRTRQREEERQMLQAVHDRRGRWQVRSPWRMLGDVVYLVFVPYVYYKLVKQIYSYVQLRPELQVAEDSASLLRSSYKYIYQANATALVFGDGVDMAYFDVLLRIEEVILNELPTALRGEWPQKPVTAGVKVATLAIYMVYNWSVSLYVMFAMTFCILCFSILMVNKWKAVARFLFVEVLLNKPREGDFDYRPTTRGVF
ncbi:hypothetical protein BABINDRAFT_9045 [Babjeviella inositovora NRRL Y-12698]|uniref:Uncharacterized protein n=1 Tax=Babjeviella inositovora NRRL Y-12698 TaxID=984486 RepID=A0A1E3QME1_9ASCO|nr:uncharacterized protein BABINDRAFT_9045 [Babjeviella inositovora NRRL Y-12698]ODQ78810.1 hypothetical protein BABINDRAFT_9045 [Babjeviella inositovora NRRL Y-12698]